MTTNQLLLKDTSIATMAIETSHALEAYCQFVKEMAAKVDCKLITYKEALNEIRKVY